MSLVAGVDDAAWPRLVSLARARGADPLDWAAIIFSESGFHPDATNPHNWTSPDQINAVGLNQLSLRAGTFGDVTGLQNTGENAIAFSKFPASVQLGYTDKFWAHFYRKFPNLPDGGARDLYWLNWEPALYVPGVPDTYQIPVSASDKKANPGFVSPDGNVYAGNITLAILRAQIESPARWAQIVAAVRDADAMVLASARFPVQESTARSSSSGSVVPWALGGAALAFLVKRFLF